LLEERGLAPSLIKSAVRALDPNNTRRIYFEQFSHLKEMTTDIVERALKGTNLSQPASDASEACK
jgi:hypothetical protein